MISLKLAIRRLFLKGQYTPTRIISLAAGLAFGILLLSEVFYFYSYDSFYPDANRIYNVHEQFKLDESSEELRSFPNVSGGVGPGLKAEVPGIEAATRLNSIGTHIFYTDNKNSLKAKFSFADEFLPDVLPQPAISGNAREILKNPMNCMVSQKVAQEMGANVVGQLIELKQYPGKKLTIAGVFENLPENTNYEYDALISMVSTGNFMWDGTNNWMGNDRYYTCIKLEPGVKPESLAPAVRKMQEKHQNITELEQKRPGFVFKYAFEPIKKLHVNNTRDMVVILSTIAIAVLFVSLLNYILLTLSSLVNRAKSSAIHKTCGAQATNLRKLIFSETFLLFCISIFGAALILILIKSEAETQLGHSLTAALNPYVIWPILGVLLVSIALASYLPGRFFSRIPVATAFRNYKQKKNKWKLALLAIQFAGASFILTVMAIVSMQYNSMKDAHHGYRAEGVYYGATTGIEGSKISMILNELRNMPEVEMVGLGERIPIQGASGNNVRAIDKEGSLFNIADFYLIDDNYLSILDIPIVEGQAFSTKTAAPNDLLMSKKGADLLKLHLGWDDGIVGKQISVTEHGETTIRGVFPDFVIRSIMNPDNRPSVFFYSPEARFIQQRIDRPSTKFNILIKVHETAQAGIINKLTHVFNMALPQNDAEIKSLEDEQLNEYAEAKGFKNAMMAGNMVILLITVIGLLGYTTNEATRRKKELAIRRISGANLSNILRVFIFDLELIAIPAVLIGLIGAWFTVTRWMQNFASKIQLHWVLFVLSSLAILILIALIAATNYTRTANRNPVESLRYE